MPLLRWALPIIAALAVVGASVTGWAVAGLIGDRTCCCPEPASCKCHDHDDQPRSTTEINRCGGTAELVAPAVLAAVLPAPIGVREVSITARPLEHDAPALLDERSDPPEPPPF